MKKEILKNNEYTYKAKYIISKKKFVSYYNNISNNNNYRYLAFYKNKIPHRPCNIGPQSKDKQLIEYKENGQYHNLYGYAYIYKHYDSKLYLIYNREYTKSQFKQYINILNQLNYKRIY